MGEATDKRKARILRREIKAQCKDNFLHFVQTYCWIEDKIRKVVTPFLLWPAQRAILPKFMSALLLIVLKARQLGLTWLTAAYCLWWCLFKEMQLVVVISAKEDWAVEFLERVRFMRRRLPKWMVPETDKDGGQWMRFIHKRDESGKPLIFSEIKSLATTPEGAQSKTPDLLVMDETSRNRYAREIFGSSYPGIEKAGGRIIVISNSHKDGVGWGWTRGVYQDAMKGLNDFERVFMPPWACPERVTETEARLLKRFPDGYDAKGNLICVTFRRKILQAGVDEEKYVENYPHTEAEAISSMLGSYFGKVLVRHQHAMPGVRGYLQDIKGEIEFIDDPKGLLEVWRFPYYLNPTYDNRPWSRRYAIGSDVSEGLGLSNSAAFVMDRRLDEMVCRMCSNRIDASEWADQLWLLSKWYKSAHMDFVGSQPALICVEKNGAGETTIKDLKDFNANLYIRLKHDKMGNEMQGVFRWQQSDQAKHTLSGTLKKYLRTTTGTVYSQQLLDECSTWIRHETGRIGPEDSTKLGDHVIAAGLTVEASLFVGEAPERFVPPATGWRAKHLKTSMRAA